MQRQHGAFISARYSTDMQNQDSIQVQVAKCTQYCNNNNIPILGVFADEAISGMKDTRPQYEAMMDQLRMGLADTVVIYDQSRMFRKITAWFAFRDELASMGVSVVSVTQPFVGGDLRDPNTFMMEGQTAIVNHMWVLLTRQKVLAKMHHMAKQGQHTGGKPALGYRVEPDAMGVKRLVIDEQEAGIVRRIFREYASGKSYKAIIDGLNMDGIKTKRGGSFGNNSLHDLLKNEKYIGTLVYGSKVYRPDGTRNSHAPEGTDVVRIEDAIPAIIDRETFAAVQERMSGNKRDQGGRPGEVREYPLRGKVFCGECGTAMHVRTSKGPKDGGKYFYYACSRKKTKHDDCPNKPIRVDQLEQLVLDHVRGMLGNAKIMQETADRVRKSVEDIQQHGASMLTALLDEQYELEAQITRIVDAIAAGAFSPALAARLNELETKKEKVAIRISNFKKAADVAALPVERINMLYDHIVTSAQTDTDAVFSVVTRVEVYHDKVLILTAFDPTDPSDHLTTTDRESIETMGIPSGVPKNQIPIRVSGFLIRRGTRKRNKSLAGFLKGPSGVKYG